MLQWRERWTYSVTSEGNDCSLKNMSYITLIHLLGMLRNRFLETGAGRKRENWRGLSEQGSSGAVRPG